MRNPHPTSIRPAWLVVLLLTAGLASATKGTPALLELLNGKAARDEPGFAVQVLQGDRVLLSRSYGVANLSTGRPIERDTLFYVASLGKTFTAAAALLLRESDKLKLETPIRTYLPELPALTRDVTVYHLLTHMSGIPDYHDASREPLSTNQDVVAFVKGLQKLEFRPGTDYAYSNTGYVLLAEIIARAAGMSYGDYVRSHILVPLGLSHTVICDAGLPSLAQRAVGYRRTEDGAFEVDDYGSQVTGPGGIYSTVGDLTHWYRALVDHELLSKRSFDLMFHMPVTLSGSQSWIAMGWFNETFGPHDPDLEGMKAYGAIGMLNGFRAILKFFPEHDLAYVILSNSSSLPLSGADVARAYLRPPAP